jgi:hypothetical protein
MQFKEWLLTEEIWQNNTATVYHRTNPESVDNILSTPFQPGDGDMYGKGLYTTFSIESQFEQRMEDTYGTTILKFKVTSLNQYIICQKSVAQQVLGQNYKISEQLKNLNLFDLYNPEQISRFDKEMENEKYSSKLAASMFSTNRRLQDKAKGLIYYGEFDGYCLLKYPPVQDGTITLIGYANNVPTNDLQKMQELKTNCKKNAEGKCENPWITSTTKVATKTLFGSQKDDKEKYIKDDFLYHVKNLAKQDLNSKENIFKFYFKKNHKDIKDLPTSYVYELLLSAKDKDKMAKILGVSNINKLTDDRISNILSNVVDKDEMAKVIAHYKQELSDENVYNLFQHSLNKTEMAELLGQDNINKLSDYNVFILLYRAKNIEEMAKILGAENIQRLTDTAVDNLLQSAVSKSKVRKILKQYNRI